MTQFCCGSCDTVLFVVQQSEIPRKVCADYSEVTTNSNCAPRDAVNIDEGSIYFQYVTPVDGTRPNSTRFTPTRKVRPFLNTVLVEVTITAQHSDTCTLTRATELHTTRLDETDSCSGEQRCNSDTPGVIQIGQRTETQLCFYTDLNTA
jgi:hypothetical protein